VLEFGIGAFAIPVDLETENITIECHHLVYVFHEDTYHVQLRVHRVNSPVKWSFLDNV
jgi:hypothetical protein